MNAEWEKFFHVFSEYTVTLRHGPDNVEQVTVEQLYKAFSERYVAEAIGRWRQDNPPKELPTAWMEGVARG